jgi:hypothetical protein
MRLFLILLFIGLFSNSYAVYTLPEKEEVDWWDVDEEEDSDEFDNVASSL